jgi:hypothetical protein
MENIILPTLIVLVVLFILFLLLRKLNCWYWKINKILAVLESIDSKLSSPSVNIPRKVKQGLDDSSINHKSVYKTESEDVPSLFCYHCGAENPHRKKKCSKCGKDL